MGVPGDDVSDGYYWVNIPEDENTSFVALLEHGEWFVPGIEGAVEFEEANIICPVRRLDH